MSLEKAIAENTAAIHNLIAALSNSPVAISIGDTVQAPVTHNSASDTVESASIQEQPEVAATKAAKGRKAESEPQATAAEGVTYAEAAAVVSKLAATKGRDVAVGVLAKFNAKVLKDVQPDQYAALIAACGAA